MEGYHESWEVVLNHGRPKLSEALAILDPRRPGKCCDILNIRQHLWESSQTSDPNLAQSDVLIPLSYGLPFPPCAFHVNFKGLGACCLHHSKAAKLLGPSATPAGGGGVRGRCTTRCTKYMSAVKANGRSGGSN